MKTKKRLEKPMKTLCNLWYYSLLYTELPKVGPRWCHAGFHNKLTGSFAFVGCKSSLSHLALTIPSLAPSSVAL